MATAYTPGLMVSSLTSIRKLRRLPMSGQVLVEVGQRVNSCDVIARAELPGALRTVRVAETLGIDPKDLGGHLLVEEGQKVSKGEVVGRSSSFFGVFKNECRSPIDGVVDMINPVSGHIGIREAPVPVEITAYVKGVISEIIPNEGAYVSATGALLQGIFGIGGEKTGVVTVIASAPDEVLTVDRIPADCGGRILIAGAGAGLAELNAAASRGAVGLIVGGVFDFDLISYLGYDIGVAITGQEQVPMTVILTEGFGRLKMAGRAWDLLTSLDGRDASINGATQIRAGVIRPELIVASVESGIAAEEPVRGALEVGSSIRLIREPYFGALGQVHGLPSELHTVASGSRVRVLVAKLESGDLVTVPRANVELIEQ